MNTSKAFGSVLCKIRKDQGFSSAHQFFKGVGGSKSLGLSFMSYWDMERGKKLPKSWRLKAIMASLGIGMHSSEAQDLVRAYFKALSGSDELLQVLAVPAAGGSDMTSRELAESATHRALSQLGVTLTMEQWKQRTQDIVSHICSSYIVNTTGWVTVGELSEATKLKPEAIKKSLKAMAAAGLIEFTKDKVRGKFEGRVIQLLPLTPATSSIRIALRNNWDAWLADSKRIASKRRTVRMTKESLGQYQQHLEKAVNLAEIYANPSENRKNSAIYLVDNSIYQVLPRD